MTIPSKPEDSMRDLIAAVASSILDPLPIVFRPEDERGVAPVRRACKPELEGSTSLRSPINRNPFLCGCLDLTEAEAIEHLIVGFGSLHGATTKVSKIAHLTGTENQVSMPEWLLADITAWLGSDHRAEVILFHNHPKNELNVIFDNLPIASTTDRRTLVANYLRPFLALKTLAGGGRIRFYLGENGYVREFHTPDVLSVLGA